MDACRRKPDSSVLTLAAEMHAKEKHIPAQKILTYEAQNLTLYLKAATQCTCMKENFLHVTL